MNVRLKTVISALALVLLALPLSAQSTQFNLGVGYQWLSVDGNKDVQRSFNGDNDGLLLDTFDLVLSDTGKTGWYDQLRVSAAGIGASPDNRFRLEIGRNKSYSLKINYFRAEVVQYLPDIANPFLSQGIVPGQHTMDRRRESLDVDLELLPGRAITPLVGYSRTTYKGSSRTTLHAGEDEFRLASDLDETADEIRAGVAFAAGSFRGAVIQGWRKLTSDVQQELAPGAGGGNNSRPVLGRDVLATAITSHSASDVHTPFTTAYITGSLADRVRLVGSYARTDSETESTEDGSITGQLVSFDLRRFFTSATDTATGKADNLNWRGELRAEVTIAQGWDFLAGYTSTHRELDGHDLLATSYLGTVNFSGADPKDIQDVLDTRTAWERDEHTVEGKLVAHPVDWLRAWAAAAKVSQEVKITPDAAEIVIPGAQGGSFDRDINRYTGGAGVDFGVVSGSVEYLKDDAEKAVVATDYTDRERWRGRLGFKLASIVRLLGTAERIELSNPNPNIDYQAKITHWAAELEVTPIEALVLRAGYDKYKADSTKLIRRPQDFVVEPSIYLEDGKNVEGGLSARFGRFGIDLGSNRYTNEGDLAFTLDRTFARVDVGITGTIGVYGQYEHRKYEEKTLPIANFEADRYGLFLRWGSK